MTRTPRSVPGLFRRRPMIAAACPTLCLSLAALAGPAFAQMPQMPSNSHSGVQPAVKFNNGQSDGPHQAPPPALPGSQANPPTAAPIPTGKSALDMQPNDALFDAINRGDVAAARDAVNRGADPESHNVLGMTPLELSVDLNRNDISFLLLSLRSGSDEGSRASKAVPPPPARTAASAAAGPRQLRKPRAATEATSAEATPAEATAAPRPAAGGGTPNPQVGFLGFDHH